MNRSLEPFVYTLAVSMKFPFGFAVGLINLAGLVLRCAPALAKRHGCPKPLLKPADRLASVSDGGWEPSSDGWLGGRSLFRITAHDHWQARPGVSRLATATDYRFD